MIFSFNITLHWMKNVFGDENIIELKVDDSNIKRAGWHLPSSIFYMEDIRQKGKAVFVVDGGVVCRIINTGKD